MLFALLLLATLVAGDAWLMGPSEGWMARAETARPEGTLERGVLASQRALLAARRGTTAPIVLLGPGRALDGESLRATLGDLAPVVDLTHPGMQPFELLAAVEEAVSLTPALVLLEFCCVDTHGPLRLGVQTAPGSAMALSRLKSLLGPKVTPRARPLLRQLDLATWIQAVRWWPLRFSSADAALSLPADAASIASPARTTWPPGDGRTTLLALPAPPVPRATADALHPSSQERFCRSVQRGRHAEVQMTLLADAVDALLLSGTPVLLVEGPLHPETRALFDRPIRTELLEALAPLAAHGDVSLLNEHQTGPFPPGEFDDLLTLGPAGRERLASALVRAVRGMLPR